MTIEQILHEAGVEKMNTDCKQGLTLEETVERIARLKEYLKQLNTLKAVTKQTTPPLTFEISDVGAAIAWHEDVLERYGTYPQFLKQFSDLGMRFANRTFDTLDSSIDKKAKSTCERFVENFSKFRWNDKNSLVLNGTTGVGKTHLAASIANKLINQNVSVFFVNALMPMSE